MKIGIYIAIPNSSIGGAELSGAILAEALARSHEVEIVHHRPSLTAGQLEGFFEVDLSNVRLRYVTPQPNPFGDSRLPWRRYQEARAWHRTASEVYDLFINFTHHLPPFCHAPVGILMVLFPLFDRHQTWPWKSNDSDRSAIGWKTFRHFYYEWEWRKRLGSYCLKTANSQFTRGWTKRRWDVDSEVVYPPLGSCFMRRQKANMILSVGRFVTQGHLKKQVEMLSGFRSLVGQGVQDWEYFCVGGLGDSPKDRAYFEKVRCLGAGYPVQVIGNVERRDLRALYERAKIFWHAAGYNNDSEIYPELEEHFGISTVEAMAAGCVPVVINRGGQREIVEHGINGFLWDTLEELVKYTMLLTRDEQLRGKMSESARARAQFFGREKFVGHFLKLLDPFLS